MVNTERLCPGCMNDNGGEKICPICGYNSAEHNGEDCLPTGMLGVPKKYRYICSSFQI